jgi:hypothetical protein
MERRYRISSALVIAACLGCTPQPGANTGGAAGGHAPAADANTLTEPVVAEAGVGKQGQSLRGETGPGTILSAPVLALFHTKQKIAFEIQIPHALNLYEALEGRKPASHAEFMTKIIQANQIQLPELPEGQEYRYHPDDGQLWVHPAGQ